MNLHPGILLPCRVIAAGLAILLADSALKAEQIRLSKPAVEIASPYKPDENLPETQSTPLGFGKREIVRPFTPQQSIIRILPREEDEDDRSSPLDSNRSSEPRRMKDPAKTRNSLAPRETYPGEFWRQQLPGFEKSDAQRALTPVMDFDWDARDSTGYSGASTPGNRPSDERDNARKRGPGANRDMYGVQSEVLPSSPFSDIFTARPKEKLSRELLDRRAAFEQMLNPGASLAGKAPGSLEPVLAPNVPRNAPSLAMPTLGTSVINPKSADRIDPFNTPDRVRGPMLEDINKRFSSPSATAPPRTIEPRVQTPLNRQPTTRELPTRRF